MPTLTIPAPTDYDSSLRNEVQLIAIPAFTDNYIWLICKDDHAVVVDPGDAEPVQAILQRHSLTLDAILLTHHHHDHVGGVPDLRTSTQAVIYGPASEPLPACDHRLASGDQVKFDTVGLSLSVLDVPGHTAGHIAYHGTLDQDTVLFCGDTLFSAGCGRLFEGTAEQMHQSLTKLAQLPDDTLVCCAHEYTLANLAWARKADPANLAIRKRQEEAQALRDKGLPTLPSTISQEQATNPFLRTDNQGVITSASSRAGHPLDNATAVFAELRDWKNHF